MRNACMLADLRGTGWLYELLPDLFPEGYLTELEIQVWNLHYRDRPK